MGWNFDGADIRVEAGFGSGLFTAPASITWTDISSYVRSIPNMNRDGRTNEYDQFQPGTATIVVDNTARRFDPTYGPAYSAFAGAGAWSAGDLAAFSGATQLDVRFAAALTDWTPAAVNTIASQWNPTGNQRSWQVYVDTTGFLTLGTSADGIATTTTNSGCRVSALDGQLICGRVTWTTTAGAVKFYIKRTTKERARADCLSNTGWTQIGATATGSTSALFNSTANVQIGTRADATLPPTGNIYYCDARTTIDSATLRFGFWPKDAASTAATSWVASAGAGETWTKVSTPTLTAQGPYYGNLTPGTPIRVSCIYSATTYRMWYGYVRRYEQDSDEFGLDATTSITCLTALGWLLEKPAPDSILGIDIAKAGSSNVFSFTPLTEGGRTPTYFDRITQKSVNTAGVAAGSVDVPYADGSARLLDTTTTGSISAMAGDAAPVAGITAWQYNYLSFQFYLTSSTSEFGLVFQATSWTGFGTSFAFNYRSDDKRVYEGYGNYNWTIPVLAPGWHQVTIYEAEDFLFTTEIRIDGVLLLKADTLDAYPFTSYPWLYANGTRLGGTAFANFVTGSYVASVNGRRNETSGDRLTWLLAAAGVPTTLQSISTDPSVFLGTAGYGGTYGQLCQTVNTAEQGRLYTTGDGTLTFKSKMSTYTATASTTSQATFGDVTDTLSYADITVDPAGIDSLVNSVTVTTVDGATAVYKDATSIGLYGELDATLSNVPLASSGDALSLAKYIVGLRAYPLTRVTGMRVTPRSSPSNLFPQVLTREIGDRITVNRRVSETVPGGTVTDNYLAAAVTIEGISHQISAEGDWTTTYTTAPATLSANEGGYFTADDAVLSVVDSGVVAAP